MRIRVKRLLIFLVVLLYAPLVQAQISLETQAEALQFSLTSSTKSPAVIDAYHQVISEENSICLIAMGRTSQAGSYSLRSSRCYDNDVSQLPASLTFTVANQNWLRVSLQAYEVSPDSWVLLQQNILAEPTNFRLLQVMLGDTEIRQLALRIFLRASVAFAGQKNQQFHISVPQQ